MLITSHKWLTSNNNLKFSVHDVVRSLYPPPLPASHLLRLHAVGTLQGFHAPHHLQVGFQGEVLTTQIYEILPCGADIEEVSHAVDICLHSWPGSVDHVHGSADHEDVREAEGDAHDSFQERRLSLLVHVDAVNVLRCIYCTQQVFKVLDLYK